MFASTILGRRKYTKHKVWSPMLLISGTAKYRIDKFQSTGDQKRKKQNFADFLVYLNRETSGQHMKGLNDITLLLADFTKKWTGE